MGVDILEALKTLGVTVAVIGPNRLRLEPASRIPRELLPRIREAKLAILEALRSRPATCGSTCYEIGPGQWIHHPWDGCKTMVTIQTPNPVPQEECRHCDGAGECSCPACTLRRTEKVVPCCTCHPQERQVWLAASRPEGCIICKGTGKVPERIQ